MLKGKVVTGVIGIFISIVALIGAVRLAKPESWWAGRRYASRPRLARAPPPVRPALRSALEPDTDLIAGAPPGNGPADGPDHGEQRVVHRRPGSDLSRQAVPRAA